MLIGRDRELTQLAGLVLDVARGHGRALLVRGEAGIGKSALLEAARVAALDRDVRVLWVAGVESETELAFSALHDLLSPVISDRGVLPAPQSAALASALALAPGVPGDRLAVCVATLRMLEHAAATGPLLVIVDDLPWVDSASRECVIFAARRVQGQLAVVLAARDDGRVDGPPGVLPQLPEMVVPALEPAAVTQLLKEVAPDIVTPVAAAVAEAAAGNPLALRGLAAALDSAQRSGLAEVPAPLAPGRQLNDLYQKRIAALDEDSRLPLLVAAAYQGDDLRVIGAACAALGGDVNRLAAAEEVELVRIWAGRLSFEHPLARGVVYHHSPAGQRRSVHAALAGVLQGESRAWHLGSATLAPNEDVAGELEAAGRAALARRGPGPASYALERAARLSPDPERSARRLLVAGEAAFAAGMPERAVTLLGQAADTTGDLAVRALAQHRCGQTLAVSAQLPTAIELLTGAAERTKAVHPSLAAAIMAEAAQACHVAADCRSALRLAEEAARLIEPSAPLEVRAQVVAMLRTALVFRGALDNADPRLADADRLTESVDPFSPAGQSISLALNLRLWTGEFERVRDDSLVTCTRAQEAGALSALPMLLVALAECQYRLGDWSAAERAATEAVATGQDFNQPSAAGHARLILVRLAAARGQDELGCRATVAATVAMAEAAGALSGVPFAVAALGFLELGLGRIPEAIEELERVARFYGNSGMEEPTLIPWEADLVEAYLRAGDIDSAEATVIVMGRRAAAAGIPTAIAPYRRCRGMVEHDFDGHFQESLQGDDQRPMPFERARTLLAYGRRLHRVRRRAEARAVLHDAVSGFAALGAKPWLTQAEGELLAAGGRRSSTEKSEVTSDTLTPHELHVAETVARGISNRQAAAELFLSPKTVEFHLMHVYRKLGISSRAQLADALRRADGRDRADP